MTLIRLKLVVYLALALFVCSVFASPALHEEKPDFGGLAQQILVRDRLPTTFIPTNYKLEIQPILDPGFGQRFTAPGRIWITGTCNGVTSSITLHSVDIEINQTLVTVQETGANTQVSIRSQDFEPAKEFYTINLTNALNVGSNYTIFIEFTSKINQEVNTGLYLSSYVADDGTTRYLAATDFEAPDARRAFPCLDEPQMKAEWEISVIRLPTYHSLSNMDLIQMNASLPTLPGWVKDTYNKSVPMSSYLVCFAVSDFLSETANSSLYNRPVKIWGPPPMMNSGAGKYSPDFSAKVMKFLEDHYMIEYSLPKMDKISLPDFSSGAMENWGLNTYRLDRLLYTEGVSSKQDLFSMTNTIAHEIVHQWFGNLITTSWWNDLWIQEGAATYYAPIAVAAVGLGDFLPMETLITATVQRSFEFDASPATHAISNLNVDPSGSVLFDTLTYHKGASLIRMMVAFLTPELYRDAMNKFLNKFAYSNAAQEDLFAVLDEVVSQYPVSFLPQGFTVSRIMDTWTLQSGFPVIKVERNELTNLVTLGQSQFVRDLTIPVIGSRWTIPISVFYSTEQSVINRPEKWILNNQTTTTLEITSPWFIINPQTTGYFRVHYEKSLLDGIIEILHTNHLLLDVQTRSALVDDNLNLAFAGYLEISQALNLTQYLVNERELFPWVSFVTNMATPYRMFSRSSSFPNFKKYIIGLMKGALNEINIQPQPNEPVPRTLLRTRLFEWACNHGDEECIAFAKTNFAAWMANPNNIVIPDLQARIYCTAVANGGDAEWEFVLEKYKEATRDTDQLNLLRALGCSKTSFRLNNLLDLALDQNSGIRRNQRATAMQAVAGNSVGVDLAFNFIRNNYDTILRRYGASVVSSTINTLTTYFNTPLDKTDLETFITSHGELSSVSLTNVDNNIKWLATHFDNFNNFIETLP